MISPGPWRWVGMILPPCRGSGSDLVLVVTRRAVRSQRT